MASVKLLFDENIAGRLPEDLSDLYPGSTDVLSFKLGGAPDQDVWDRAGREGFVLVTKDQDFHRLSVMIGPPPKVIWLRVGNSTTDSVERLLRSSVGEVTAFVEGPDAAFLALG